MTKIKDNRVHGDTFRRLRKKIMVLSMEPESTLCLHQGEQWFQRKILKKVLKQKHHPQFFFSPPPLH